jgi:LytS/YehU family sensor histidine kinase
MVFRYMLDPVDKTWRYTKDQTIIYADLKPDRYRLTLECAENNHFIDADRKEISFVIQSPYWTRWWFILAVLAILVGGILTVARSRDRRRKEIAAIKTDQVKAELETLKSQINPHFLFNSFNTLISVIETDPKDAVHFVEKLSDFYRHMLQYRDTELIAIKEEMEIQENYQYLLKMRFGEGIAFHVQLQANQNVHIIPLTLQLLSENAIKHNIVSRENPLNIYIQEESDWLVFKNKKRPRMSVEKSTYFGLKTLSARYRAIVGKDIQIRDEAGQFIVKIPLIYT